MIFGRRRDQIDRIRERIRRSSRPRSNGVGEAIARLSIEVGRFLRAVERERAEIDGLRSAVDRIPEGVVLADAGGTIVYRNRVARGFVDARHGEALVAGAIDEMIAAAATGIDDRHTIDLFGPPRRAIQLRSGPLRADEDEEGIVGAFVLIEDITQRQRLEAVRRDFVANISHELKTPAGALTVLAETMVDEPDPEALRRLAVRMQREADRLTDLIEDLLQLSRIEVDRLPDPEPVSIETVVADAIEHTMPAAEANDIRFETGSLDGLEVLGHPRQLTTALTNLLDNAVKYSEPDGVVIITGGRDRDRVILAIADRGIGIPSRDLGRIFERFYRVDQARSRDTGGTGLGLSIVRHVVQNHEGEIEVTSREGRGTTFTLLLPAVDESGTDG